MIVWMRRHARELSGQLRAQRRRGARGRLDAARWSRWRSSPCSARGSRPSSSCSPCSRTPTTPRAPGSARCSASPCAVAIGLLIYRGGVKLNLARFFRITGFVLVLVAAGLVASAMHTAHEAGWLNAGQGQAFDLSWLVVPGHVDVGAADRHARLAAAADGRRGDRLPRSTPIPAAALRAAGPRSVGARAGAAARSDATTTLLLVLVPRWRSPPAARSRTAPRPAPKQVEVKLTDAGCSPADAQARRRPHDLQGHERRHRPGQRVRGARGHAHPRREGEPRRRPLRRLHAHAAAGPATRSAAPAARPPRPAC